MDGGTLGPRLHASQSGPWPLAGCVWPITGLINCLLTYQMAVCLNRCPPNKPRSLEETQGPSLVKGTDSLIVPTNIPWLLQLYMGASPSFISWVKCCDNWSQLSLASLPPNRDFKEYSQAAAKLLQFQGSPLSSLAWCGLPIFICW